MFRFFIVWLSSAVALAITVRMVQGYFMDDVRAVLIATVAIGFLNGSFAVMLHHVTSHMGSLTFGLSLLVFNGLLILAASRFVPGFNVNGWHPIAWGALVLAVLETLVRSVLRD
jgi:putative membrane protein